MLVIILKCFAKPAPDRFCKFQRVFQRFVCGIVIILHYIMMNINYNIHFSFIGVIHYFLDPSHPVVGNIKIFVNVSMPSHGYAYSIETRTVNIVYHFLGDYGRTPCGFRRLLNRSFFVCVKSIPKVPADFHILYKAKRFTFGQFP